MKGILKRITNLEKRLNQLEKKCCSTESDEVVIAPGLRAMQLSTTTKEPYDPNNPAPTPAVDRTVYHNGSTDDLADTAINNAGFSDATAIYSDPAGTVLIPYTNGLAEAYYDGNHYISFASGSPDVVYVAFSDDEVA